MFDEYKYYKNTETYQLNCGDGSNLIDNLENKEFKHKDSQIKIVGYHKNKNLFEDAKEKVINLIKKF